MKYKLGGEIMTEFAPLKPIKIKMEMKTRKAKSTKNVCYKTKA